MKILIHIIKKYVRYISVLLFFMCMSTSMYSQTHTIKTIVYNTLVLNSSKLLMKNAHLGIKATIIKGDEKGHVIYAEILKGQTNNKGNLAIDIGVGYVVAGKYSNFDFTSGPYMIKLEIDPHGGTNYTINITRPFVNLAKGSATTFRFAVGSKVIVKRYVGELYGGGIIFHLNKDSLGNEHGLVASLQDVSVSTKWGLSGIDFYGFKNASDGKDNYKAMLNNGAEPGTAARVVEKYQHDGYKDWYLPALKELLLLYQVKDVNIKVKYTLLKKYKLEMYQEQEIPSYQD